MKMNWGREGKRERSRDGGEGGQSREGCLVGGGERCKDQILDLPPLCLAGNLGTDNTHKEVDKPIQHYSITTNEIGNEM